MNLYDRFKQWRVHRQSHTIILLYHRIAKVPFDPQLLCVTPEHFTEHMDVLAGEYTPMRLLDLNRRLSLKGSLRRNVIITFDDGYEDNLLFAKPILERYEAPATFFIVAGQLNKKSEFWWDDLGRIFFSTPILPDSLTLTIANKSGTWHFQSKLPAPAGLILQDDKSIQNWHVLEKNNPTARHAAYREIAGLLRGQNTETCQFVMQKLTNWAGLESTGRVEYTPLDAMGVRSLAQGGLMEIGAHTMTHPLLSALPVEAQRTEIAQSKLRLEEILDQKVQSFSYPFGCRGDYTETTVNLLKETGFQFACTNFEGFPTAQSDPYQLPRFLVRDWGGEEFAKHLARWRNG